MTDGELNSYLVLIFLMLKRKKTLKSEKSILDKKKDFG